jgi:hypothetical protein
VSQRLRRIIDLGPGGVINPGSALDYSVADNRVYFAETGTRWLRLWADWPSLQPLRDVAVDDPANPGFFRLEALDAQIAAANEDGVRVVLMPYRFPNWANDTDALAAVRNTDAEISFGYPDRIGPSAWQRYLDAGRDPARYNPSRRGLEFHVPDEGVGPGTAWERFFDFLYARYHLGHEDPTRRVHGFELVNEPNLQPWPQRAPSETDDPFGPSPLIVQHTMAQYMVAAQAVAERHGDTTLRLAPSLADSEILARTVTPFLEFTSALLDALDAAAHFPGPTEAWAHHNYTDLERRREDTGVQAVRALIRDRWTGYVEGEAPTVWITEGGVRVPNVSLYYPDEDPLEAQALSIAQGWERHVRDDGPGAGVAMFAQYQTYTDPRFDAGLLEPWPSTVRRPAYAVWGSLPSHG